MKKISLVKLKRGSKGKIVEVSGGPEIKRRMMAMGIYPGKEITKLSQFLLRGALTIKLGRSVVALGHSVAAKITVETK